jgi:hypothetical protein
MAQPQKRVSEHDITKLPSVEELAVARFGKADGLALLRQTTLEMAQHYATRFNLDQKDPEVSMITAVLAFTRQREFQLLIGCEQDVQQRVLDHPTDGYTEVLFKLARKGAHRDVHREIDRLHSRASKYISELRTLQNENTDNNNGTS